MVSGQTGLDRLAHRGGSIRVTAADHTERPGSRFMQSRLLCVSLGVLRPFLRQPARHDALDKRRDARPLLPCGFFERTLQMR